MTHAGGAMFLALAFAFVLGRAVNCAAGKPCNNGAPAPAKT
jgi:hypothetical protein